MKRPPAVLKQTHSVKYSSVEKNKYDRADASGAFTSSFTGTNVCVLTHFEDFVVQWINKLIQVIQLTLHIYKKPHQPHW